MRIGQVQLPLILWLASMVHVGLGVAILLDNRAVDVLIIVGLQEVTQSLSPNQTGVMLILVSILSAMGLLYEYKLSRTVIILVMMPQYFLLIASLISDVGIIISGYRNSSGTQIPIAVTFSALWTIMSISILHTLGILERYFWKWNSASHF